MQDGSRMYDCLKTNSPIIICSYCYRGNMYCKHYLRDIYLNARRTANGRYQSTYQGCINHTVRQKRYRKRLKKKLTHPGSKDQSVRD